MKISALNTTLIFYPNKNPNLRLAALWYFVALMTIWTILGHTILGFEQSHAAVVAGVGAAVFMQYFLEWVDATARGREVRWAGSWAKFANSLPAPLITGFACAMLLYPNDRLWPIIFSVAVSIGSKVLFRAPVGDGRTQHIFNPSNIGIALTLLLFPDVGFAPPYQFTENITGAWNWILPVFILATGIIIHGWFTGRLPLVAAWIGGFALQGEIRAHLFHTPALVPLMPMTSAAFVVFTLYMVPDPATTPLKPWRQAAFGFAVAAMYGVIQVLHLVYGLFFALVIVSAVRGISLNLYYYVFRSRNPASAKIVMPLGIQVPEPGNSSSGSTH